MSALDRNVYSPPERSFGSRLGSADGTGRDRKTATDVVRGPQVDNAVMCELNAQMMIASTDLVRADGSEYMKVVCTPSKNADEWMAEIEARKAALQ